MQAGINMARRGKATGGGVLASWRNSSGFVREAASIFIGMEALAK
jgi:hypothetical protein